MSLFTELKRRHVFRIGIAYLVVAWLIVQVIAAVSPMLELPGWFGKAVLVLLAIGFPVALALAWAFEMTPEGVRRTDDLDGATPKRAVSIGRKLDFVIIGALILALGYFVWERQPAPGGASTASTDTPSIAVLPFADLSPNGDQEYFSDGLSEEILNQLALLPELRVIGRTSSFAFKGKNEDLRTIAKTLGVNHILEGSVRKAGNQLRITAQLIRATDGSHLWSETYDRNLDDVFQIQEDIAKTVARSLRISIGALDLTKGGTRNVAAYDAFLAGQAMEGRSDRNAGLDGLSALERAVAIDPNFTTAWASLANAYGVGIINYPGRTDEFVKKQDVAIHRVLQLAPGSPAANVVLANREISAGHLAEADRLLQSVRDLPPALGLRGYIMYGQFLMGVGRPEDAVPYLQLAWDAEPVVTLPSVFLQIAYEIAGDYQRADEVYERARPNTLDKGLLDGVAMSRALATRDTARIKQALPQALQTDPDIGGPISRVALHDFDDPAKARAELRLIFDDPSRSSLAVQLGALSQWAGYFDDPELALKALQRMQRQGGTAVNVMFSMWRPAVKNIRKLPGFKDLVRDLGLVDYWRKTGNWGDFCRPVGDNDFECE